MKDLIIKEFKLAMHPTSIIFIFLASMVMIPNYPYLIIFFYMCLSIFFICLSGRENKDIDFTMLLPVRKRDTVKARFMMIVLLEIMQIIFIAPFISIRALLIPNGNAVGLDANIVLLGFGFFILGIFNYCFFTVYYKDVNKVGKPFFLGCIAITIAIIIIEMSMHVVPFARNYLDTPDPNFIGYKLIVLMLGIIFFVIITFLAYKKSSRNFEKLDL